MMEISSKVEKNRVELSIKTQENEEPSEILCELTYYTVKFVTKDNANCKFVWVTYRKNKKIKSKSFNIDMCVFIQTCRSTILCTV